MYGDWVVGGWEFEKGEGGGGFDLRVLLVKK